MAGPRVTAVVLAFGESPHLVDAVTTLLDSRDVDLEVIVVDNGGAGAALAQLRPFDGVRIIGDGRNLGYTGGVNLGASSAAGDHLAFVNSDAIVAPDALSALVAALADDEVALASGSVRLADRPELINSAGNPVHYSGLSWAGGLGTPASQWPAADITAASGALMMTRTSTWQELGGLYEPMFAYMEDTELSLRCWQRGWRVRYVPEAVATHHYEFSRHARKFQLLERNRLLMVATLWPARLLMVAAPVLVGLELAMTLVALRDGWLRHKATGWLWLWRHRREVIARRRDLRAARVIDDRAFAALLVGDVTPGEGLGLTVPALARTASRAYWRLVRRLL